MKKYLVVKQYCVGTPTVVGTFDNWEDANNFAILYMKSDVCFKYWVYELSEK